MHARTLLAKISSLPFDSLVGRVARIPLKLLPRGAVLPVLSGPLRGRKWILGAGIYQCWVGTYEYDKQEVICRTVRPGTVFYDIGANVGFYSLLASGLVKTGKVCAFEPLPRNLSYLRRHLELNGIANVEVFPVAVSNIVGTSCFREEDTGLMGQLGADGSQIVPTTSLDYLVFKQRVAPPDFIKMDIEGAELNALQGATRLFQVYRPTLFLATHGKQVHRECCRLLSSWRYSVQPLGSESLDDATELIAAKQHN
jgi:FkbM family methyltransferase